jgi:hypothetical protein
MIRKSSKICILSIAASAASWPGTDVWSSQMRYVALIVGGADVMVHIPVKKDKRSYVWDYAGGHLIFREAGGKSRIWMAIHHAVYYRNFETFLVLINPKYGASIASPDSRGWTLLHIAASAGHDNIVRHLLSLGADHERLTLPYASRMPEQLFNQTFTPAKAAAAQSRERYCRYIEVLDSFGLKDSQDDQANERSDDDDDEFIDAEENLSFLQ